jgi:transcriptional regulator with XRE-family HTH domain
MDTIRLGLGFRALRRRRGWSQDQLARNAGSSRSVIWRIERGHADRVTVRTLTGVATALGARIDLRLLWHGEGLDRLLDVRHAGLIDRALEILTSADWQVATEVSFNIRGERGSIDILAFHAATGSLVVIEVKSVVPDLQAMLYGLDRKGRLASEIARARGWNVRSVTKLLILPDDRTARRRVDAFATTFDAALPARTVEVRQWIHRPDGTRHGVMFLSDAPQAGSCHRGSKAAVRPRRN